MMHGGSNMSDTEIQSKTEDEIFDNKLNSYPKKVLLWEKIKYIIIGSYKIIYIYKYNNLFY